MYKTEKEDSKPEPGKSQEERGGRHLCVWRMPRMRLAEAAVEESDSEAEAEESDTRAEDELEETAVQEDERDEAPAPGKEDAVQDGPSTKPKGNRRRKRRYCRPRKRTKKDDRKQSRSNEKK